jgi:hypothetical protein
MKKSFRYLAFAGLAAVLVLALTESSANAQFRRGFPVAPVTPATANFMFANRTPITVPLLGTPGVGVNTNYYLNPYTTLNQAAYNTAVTGRALSTIPPYWLGYNPYPQVINYGPMYSGYNPYLYSYTPYTYNPYLYSTGFLP